MAEPQFSKDQQVRQISSRDIVGYIVKYTGNPGGINWYKVNFNGRIVTCPEHNLETYTGDIDVENEFVHGNFARKTSFSKLLTYKKLSTSIRNNLYSLFASKTEFHPYQYKPLLKFLDSDDQRLLIADEVGLGKTIESGLILIEQRARNPLDRVLIVCPSSLTRKWRDEMRIRFDEEFEILNTPQLSQFFDDYIRDGNRIKLRGIVSLQSIRNRKIQETLENLEPSLDLVIIDEAHHLRNIETLSHKVGQLLSNISDALVLLTATPIHLGREDLFNLLKILRPNEFDNFFLFKNRLSINQNIIKAERAIIQNPTQVDECMNQLKSLTYTDEKERFLNNPIYKDILYRLDNGFFKDRRHLLELQRDISNLNMVNHIISRTRKREVQKAAKRTSQVISHNFTDEEKEFYDAVTNFVKSKYRKYGGFGFEVFVAMSYQRQVASCIPAMVNFYKKKFNLKEDIVQNAGELSDIEIEDWVRNDIDFELSDNQEEFIRLIASCKIDESIDTKYDNMLKQLKLLDDSEPNRKILLFSYFKKTLEYLSKRLSKDGYKNLMIHGDIKPEDRNEAMIGFRDNPTVRILLSSEVGSEGLDFQHCHVMINYDLPWNPMKVEQRIGRLDRFGQQSDRIIIINIVTNNTIEEKILTRLYERIKIFEESIGDLEPILGERINELTRDILSSSLTEEEEFERIQQIADAIERERLQQQKLEEESSKLIGFDEYFQEEISRFAKFKNFISGDELKTFVTEFLKENYPALKLKRTSNPKIFILPMTNQFLNNIRENTSPNDPVLRKFIDAFYRNGKNITVTFDSEEANKDKTLEFINNQHPLVRLINKYYDFHKDQLFPIAKIKVEYNKVPEGYYFYFIYLIEFTGARAEKRLETVVIKRDNLEIFPLEISEEFIGNVKIHGTDLDGMPEISVDELQKVFNIATKHIHQLREQREQELKRINDSLINNRIVSLKKSFEYKIQKAQERLENTVAKKGDARIIRMNEGRIRNLNAERDQKIHEVEKGREVISNFEEIAAGIIGNFK